MVTENYPANFIRRNVVNPISPSDIVTTETGQDNLTSASSNGVVVNGRTYKVGDKVQGYLNSSQKEKNRIKDQLKDQGYELDSDRDIVPIGTYLPKGSSTLRAKQ